MADEIHGIISREDAWAMWAPYGERAIPALEGEFTGDNLVLSDARAIAAGATQEDRVAISRSCIYGGLTLNDDLKASVEAGPSQDLIDVLAVSHTKQQRITEQKRERALSTGVKYAHLLLGAANRLRRQNIFTRAQLDSLESRLIAPDGSPYIQFTPMSRLEENRYLLKITGAEPSHTSGAVTDINHGVIEYYVNRQTVELQRASHSRVHEHVHANFAGLELWDQTSENGMRYPQHYAFGPHGYLWPGKAVGMEGTDSITNEELNEGWTEFIARHLISVEPKLGKAFVYDTSDAYEQYYRTVASIRRDYPEMMRMIIDAALTEVIPAAPYAKREALQALNEYADKKLGKGGLPRLLVQNGGSFHDYHKTNKTEP